MRWRRPAALALLGLLGTAPLGWGAARARLGGTLSLGLLGPWRPGLDGGVEGPEADSLQALVALPLCRLLPDSVAVLASFARAAQGPTEAVVVTPRASARFLDGTALSGGDVAAAWRRLLLAQSPYASLLAPVAHLEETLEAAVQHPEAPLRLGLQYPWPDLEASLCHPAFTPLKPGAAGPQGIGLYGPLREGRAPALLGSPGGPTFPAFLSLSVLLPRAASRALQRGEVQLLLGEATAAEASPLLFATYLAYRPEALPAGVLAALARVDLEALVRTFVPGPAAALHGLLPEALGEALLPGAKHEGPGTSAPGRSFTLGYEAGQPEQKAVAERLQVLLHDAGYAVRLLGDSRENLARAKAAGTLPAALVSVLLPPLAAPALAVVLGLGGDSGLLARELPGLGAVQETQARSALAAARARALLGQVALYPLYVRGLRVQAQGLLDVRRDAFGLLVLDEAFLAH